MWNLISVIISTHFNILCFVFKKNCIICFLFDTTTTTAPSKASKRWNLIRLNTHAEHFQSVSRTLYNILNNILSLLLGRRTSPSFSDSISGRIDIVVVCIIKYQYHKLNCRRGVHAGVAPAIIKANSAVYFSHVVITTLLFIIYNIVSQRKACWDAWRPPLSIIILLCCTMTLPHTPHTTPLLICHVQSEFIMKRRSIS